MQSITEKKLILYTCLFIAAILNMSKLLALREGAYIGQYWHFNGWELLFQAILNFCFCIALTYVILNLPNRLNTGKATKYIVTIIVALLLLFITDAIGINVQQNFFLNKMPDKLIRATYTTRLFVSAALILILIRVIYLLREGRAKDKENERLQNAYLSAQLQLLKEELNPHFFFNALSTLSAIVRENSKLAQQYISHLSKIFRYTLNPEKKEIVTLKEELEVFNSYAALMKMRLENALQINIDLTNETLQNKLPYMSLQPLLENAIKHNAASAATPLYISISTNGNGLIVQNNLQPIAFAEDTTGTGLANLNERFRILVKQEIDIKKTSTDFSVKLPFLNA